MKIIYFINDIYHYPDNEKEFKLIEVDGYIFRFDCGHWVTDTVFKDLIRKSTGIQVYKEEKTVIFDGKVCAIKHILFTENEYKYCLDLGCSKEIWTNELMLKSELKKTRQLKLF